MSTRSSIAVQQGNIVKTVYCHFDGYPDHVGRMLLNHYNNQEGADSIVNLGDLSSLSQSVEKPEGHSYATPVEGYSIFYGRDRGEKNVAALVVPDYATALKRNRQEYNYFWDGTQWTVDGKPLTMELIETDE